jgi:hypothetical protein
VARDLSNTRLAQNQGELSRKIEASVHRYSGNKVCEGRVIKEVIGKVGFFDRGWAFWIRRRLH